MPKPAVHADIRVGPNGVEAIDLEVSEGRRSEALAWLERNLPILQSFNREAVLAQAQDRLRG